MERSRVASERLELLAVVLAIAAATVVAWWNLLGRGLIPLTGDALVFSYPRWKLATAAWRDLSVPLWNPYQDMGEPHLADPTTSALYPPLILLSPLRRFGGFLLVWVIVHTAIAAGFMGALVWRRTRDPASSLAGAALAGVGGAFISHVTFPEQLASAAWLPACLALQQRRSTPWLAGALAMQWLAGFPPFSLLTAIALGAIALVQGKESLGSTVAAGLAGAGLAAPEAIPFLELLAHSVRHLVLDRAVAGTFSLTVPALLKEVFLPQWSMIAPSLPGDPAMMTFYAGPAALLVAGLAVAGGAKANRWIASGTAAALVLSLGAHLPFYAAFPPLRIFRFPANWLLLAGAGFSLLAALGTARLRSRRARWIVALLIAADLAVFARHLHVGWAEPAVFEDPPPVAATLQPGPHGEPAARVFHAGGLLGAWLAHGVRTVGDYDLLRDALFPSLGTAFGVSEARSYQVLRLERAAKFQHRLDREGPSSASARWADIGLFVDLDPAGRSVDRQSLRLVRVGTGGGRVFLEPPSAGQVTIVSYRPGSVDVSVLATRDATLVFDEVSYPGWHVAIDGRRARLGLFADTFMSVPLKPGSHRVAFRYLPLSFVIGVATSALTFVGLAAAWLGRRRRGRADPASV